MKNDEILYWLKNNNEHELQKLWKSADDIRSLYVGSQVHLRGLIEFSNHCRRKCAYCGINANNNNVSRYRMSEQEILNCAGDAVDYGYGTVVLQSGEDMGVKTEWLAKIIQKIKSKTPLAVTLSVGERSFKDVETWKKSGADRYLLRFETSDPVLYQRIHPSLPGQKSNRFILLEQLKKLDYEVGSGVMIGIPGQTYETLAKDLSLFKYLNLDMIGVGPYIPHPDTELVTQPQFFNKKEQVPNTELMTYKVVALTRILCPEANIPSTTALATLNIKQGRELGLERGANVVMPNITPPQYRKLYEIYPAKACLQETTEQCHTCMKNRILYLGRETGTGPGNRKHQVI